MYHDPTSLVAEAYRTIRTAVYFSASKTGATMILVTSPEPGDGKTTLVANLAAAMAQSGRRTLIIDGDVRNPMQHMIFNVEQAPGLSSILSGSETFSGIIKSTFIDGLDLLPSGPRLVRQSEVINCTQFTQLLHLLAVDYDYVLIDSPPVLAVTDARIIGSSCNGCVLVFRADKTTRKASEEARASLVNVGAHLLGVVINGVPRSHNRYGKLVVPTEVAQEEMDMSRI